MSDDRFKDDEKPFVKYAPIKHKELRPYFSQRAPGTPLAAENLFQLLQKGESTSAAFSWTRRLVKLTDDEVWEAYGLWLEGKIHPKLVDKK